MNRKKAIKMYSDDISRIKLPPISDEVRQAIRKKGEEHSQKPEHHVMKINKNVPMKFILSAMLLVFIVCVSIIIILSKNTYVTPPSEASDNWCCISNVNEVNKPNVLKIIMEKKTYGTVSLSKNGEFLQTYSEDTQVYEDDSYIYNFDTDGNLLEVLNTKHALYDSKEVKKTDIEQTAEDLFALYFPQFERNEYKVTVQEYKDSHPSWMVDFTRTTRDIIDHNIRMTFDRGGNLYMILSSSKATDAGMISKIQAVDIALDEIKNGKYGISDFDRDEVEIHIGLSKEIHAYIVTFDHIPTKDNNFTISAIIKIDYNNKKIISVELQK